MRVLLFAGFLLALSPLTGCDSTGIDLDSDCQLDCVGDDLGSDGTGSDNSGGDGGAGSDVTIDVDPRQTYTRTSDDKAIDSPAVSLSGLGYAAGDAVCFRAEGDFRLVDDYHASDRGDGLLTAVFSGSDELRDSDLLDRVAGAIDAGDDVFTIPTDRNALQTDITQDFSADDVCLTIPDGAEFVFFAAYDSFYADNGSIDGTPFRVRIEK